MKRQHKAFYFIPTLFAVLIALPALGQNAKNLVRKGNKSFEKGKFSDAEIQYRKALEKDPKFEKGTFNLGDALYHEKNFDEAGKQFLNINKNSKSNDLKSKSWYNLGNVLMQKKQYEKSMGAFINALRLNPDDYNAKYNLEYARKMLKKQQQQNKQNKNKDNKDKNNKNQNQNKQDNKKNKDKDKKNKDKKKQDNKKNQNNNKDQNKNNQQQKNQPQNQRPKMSKADAQRMLDALKNKEKDTVKKLAKKKAKAVKGKPDVINW